MAKIKTITINGVTFEVKYIDEFAYNSLARSIINSKTLWQCYNKPSHIKELIFCEWVNFFNNLKYSDFGVISYNGFMFTLGCFLDVVDLEIGLDGSYPVKITPSHNYLYIAK